MPPKSKKAIKPKVENNIDLQCTLCPKNPRFSDASHLLTHISSKGHLSHRFKLQIRAQTEQEARDILENFDMWYSMNNMDNLLAERLALKDNKTKRKTRNPVSSGVAAIKPEHAALTNESMSGPSDYRAPIPRMHLWSISADGPPSLVGEFDQTEFYSTPTAQRHIPNFSPSDPLIRDNLDPQLNTPWQPQVENEEKESGSNKSTDSAKLKGVIWPGMDLFDSATPQQKRMRNQKKDNSVLRGMMNSSLDVDPMEISYHANGELRSSRDIFGPLSDLEESPTRNKTRSASPKKRKARKPAALADGDFNVPRIRVPRGRKPGTRQDKEKKVAIMQAPPPVFMQPAPILNPLASGLRQFSDDYNEEFRLTAHGLPSKKRGFSIFKDTDAPEVSPGRTESPLEEQNYDNASNSIFDNDPFTSSSGIFHHGLPSLNNQRGSNIIQASPTPVARAGLFRPTGKENLLQQPEMQQSRRTLSASHVYPAQVFHDPTRNPLFQRHHGYAHSFSYGQHTFSEQPPKPTQGFESDFQENYRPAAHMSSYQQMVHNNTMLMNSQAGRPASGPGGSNSYL